MEIIRGETVIVATVDLCWRDRDGKYFLLDFKTDRDIPGDSGYRFQMQLYAMMMEEILGHIPDEAILYFLRQNVQQKIPLSLEKIESVRRKLVQIIAGISGNRFNPIDDERCEDCGYFFEKSCYANLATQAIK